MEGEHLAELIIGVLGNVTSTFLFLSPISTFKEIHRKRSVGQFSSLPYLAMFLNCSLWAAYGVFLKGTDQILVLTTNSVGASLSFIYIISYAYYADKHSRKRVLVLLSIVVELLIAACAVTSVVLEFFTSPAHKRERGSMILGVIGVGANLILYASPLSIAKKVITTRNVDYWPYSTSLASLINGLVWTIYASFLKNTFILVPNVLGCLLALIQLLIYAKFKNSANSELDKEISANGSTASCGDQPNTDYN